MSVQVWARSSPNRSLRAAHQRNQNRWDNNRVERAEFWSSHPLYLSTWPAPGKPLTLQNTYTYEYNTQGRIVKVNNYFGANNLRSYTVWEYDNLGRKVATKHYSPENQEFFTTSCSYDNRNNLENWQSSYWEYDNKPNPFRLLNVPSVGAYEHWVSTNNATSNFGKDPNGNKINVWRYEYTYDGKTNFPLAMKTIVSGQPTRETVFVYR